MIDPPRWTEAEFAADAQTSEEMFRKERLEEPLEAYLEAFDNYQGNIEDFFETTVDLTDLQGQAIEALTDPKLLHVLRYLAGPPISADDLKIIAEASSLSPKKFRQDQAMVQRIVEVVLTGLDRRRFPWIIEKRDPTEAEKQAAIMASAALMAVQKVGTVRRHEGKKAQESKVEGALQGAGYVKVPTRKVGVVDVAPAPGEFCRESELGNRKADFLFRLLDRRIMPIECKVSNSSTNSVKRLNNDAAVKATSWRTDFGERQVVPVAVLSGVYKLHNLMDAQDRGLTIFWSHNLEAMLKWIATARSK